MTHATVDAPLYVGTPRAVDYGAATESAAPAVSWQAVAGGAFAGVALTLALFALGSGMGLSSLSPWSTSGATPKTVGIGALAWFTIVEIIASGIGGYIAGRLRTRWVNVHSHEVYFRDTAHGFLAWSVGHVMSAAVLSTAAIAMAGGAVQGAASRPESGSVEAHSYFVDRLYRTDHAAAVLDPTVRSEAGRVFVHALAERQLAADDQAYLAETVAAHTGISRAEASKRVGDIYTEDLLAADNARKAVAHSLYWLFVALLIGAFTGSWAATLGGKRRDLVYT
jgi:hypothetical protein